MLSGEMFMNSIIENKKSQKKMLGNKGLWYLNIKIPTDKIKSFDIGSMFIFSNKGCVCANLYSPQIIRTALFWSFTIPSRYVLNVLPHTVRQ